MEWWQHIHADPHILNGKPTVKGTRLSVEFILSLLANGWSQEAILENYPQLKPEHFQAIFSFLGESLQDETVSTLPQVV